MSRAGRSAMQVTLFRRSAGFLAAGRAIHITSPWRERLEDRIEMPHNIGFAANHLAVAALESPYAAAGAHVHIVQPFGGQFLCPADIIDVVGISAVNHDVARRQLSS